MSFRKAEDLWGKNWNFNLDVLLLILFLYAMLLLFNTVFEGAIVELFFVGFFLRRHRVLGFQDNLPSCKVFSGRAELWLGLSDPLGWGSIH